MEDRQADFCHFRDIKVLVCSFNIDNAKPSDLSGTEENVTFLDQLMQSVDSPDIIVFGFQELISLTDKKLTASAYFTGRLDCNIADYRQRPSFLAARITTAVNFLKRFLLPIGNGWTSCKMQ
jgi:hypothetical protein